MRHTIEPRMIPKGMVATYINKSPTWMQQHKEELRETNFPKPHPILRDYDRKQLDEWIDRTSGIKETRNESEARLLAKLENGDF